MRDRRPDLAELEPAELAAVLSKLGAREFHARQIFRWLHHRGHDRFDGMTNLSLDLRQKLDEACVITTPTVTSRELSTDGTQKFLFTLSDGRAIESVFIPDTPTLTLCISTQVGCAMRCSFCLTGQMGLTRNLTAGEIAGQVRVLVRELDLQDRRFNIVLMGMGEPLHNYDATMKALRILAVPDGLGLTPRRITLSTVGILPALARLGEERWVPNLAVSLHATTDRVRHRLIPTSRKQRLTDLITTCRRFPLKHRERITFEYVLLSGVNDTPEDAVRLVKLLHGLRAKVNLIPLNETSRIPFSRPPDQQVDRFARTLARGGITVSVRKSRGQDIRAACGQLILEDEDPRPIGQRLAKPFGD